MNYKQYIQNKKQAVAHITDEMVELEKVLSSL